MRPRHTYAFRQMSSRFRGTLAYRAQGNVTPSTPSINLAAAIQHVDTVRCLAGRRESAADHLTGKLYIDSTSGTLGVRTVPYRWFLPRVCEPSQTALTWMLMTSPLQALPYDMPSRRLSFSDGSCLPATAIAMEPRTALRHPLVPPPD